MFICVRVMYVYRVGVSVYEQILQLYPDEKPKIKKGGGCVSSRDTDAYVYL